MFLSKLDTHTVVGRHRASSHVLMTSLYQDSSNYSFQVASPSKPPKFSARVLLRPWGCEALHVERVRWQ